jgi:hypothetical protein
MVSRAREPVTFGLLVVMLLVSAVAIPAGIAFSGASWRHGVDARLDRVEHRLDRLETTTTTRRVRAQANRPSRPTTTIGACVIVRGFPVKMSDEDAARVGGRRCER